MGAGEGAGEGHVALAWKIRIGGGVRRVWVQGGGMSLIWAFGDKMYALQQESLGHWEFMVVGAQKRRQGVVRDEIGEAGRVWIIQGFVCQVSRHLHFILKTAGATDGF